MTYTYVVSVHNYGPSDAQSVLVTDTWPAGFTRGTLPAFCANVASGPNFTCTLGTIAAGADAGFSITYKVPAATLGSQTNTVSVSSTTTDNGPNANTASDDTTVNTLADLSISKTDNTTSVTAGDGLTYTYVVSVHNYGPSDAQSVLVTDTWPAGFTRGTLPAFCANVASGPNFTCTLGTIAAGADAGFSITYKVPSTTDTGDQANSVTVSSSTPDGVGANNGATDHTNVLESVILHITKTFADVNVTAGTAGHTFTIAVSNSGLSDADHVHVVDNLPSRLVATAVTSSGFACTFTGTQVDCTRLHLDPSDNTLTITVTYTASSGPEALNVSNTASVTSDEISTPVTSTATVNITKRSTTTTVSCSPSSIVINDVTTCTATVSDSDGGAPTAPSGTVAWTRTGAGGGTFVGSPCNLAPTSATTSKCTVTYTPNSGAGVHTVIGTYSGSTSHVASAGSAPVTAGLRTTSTTLSCSPVVVPIGTSMTCTTTVTDTQAQGTKTSPLGTVSFGTDNPTYGMFTPTSCNLVAGPSPTSSCSVSYQSTVANVDNLTALYTPNDNVHSGSSTTSFTIVVTYDPTGGFVTGGGYILQPSTGAYPVVAGSAGAKNNYGFNAKYKNGASVPTGELEFLFKPGNINFHGQSFDWLVITTLSNGTMKAEAQGSGTINGAGNYGFLVTVIDGGSNDTFRIRIFDKTTNATTYDNEYGTAYGTNPTTVAAGGNIVIHAK